MKLKVALMIFSFLVGVLHVYRSETLFCVSCDQYTYVALMERDCATALRYATKKAKPVIHSSHKI